MEALLRVYQLIIGDTASDVGSNSTIVVRILTPSEQAASLIDGQGALINSIMQASQTKILVLDGDLPPVALEEDRVIEIWGLPARVRKALELVASQLRKYLVDRSVIPLFDSHMPTPTFHMDMPSCHYNDHHENSLYTMGRTYDIQEISIGYTTKPWVFPLDATELPPTPNISAHGPEASPSFRMHRPTTVENLLHCRVSACGPEAAPHVDPPSLTSQSTATDSKIKKKMQVPIFYAEAVIGPAGERIEYIRRASRCSILINDSKEGAMSIEITGSSVTDILTAEQLIKNFMAECAAASPGHTFDFIPSYLPAARSPQADTLATSKTSGTTSLPEQRLQMIY
ncbi:hypothetical protein QOZ80_2AG0124400 [Eleusine coracana subsp. coracana]|nr:hypothetical protein QOZ80_2AG0124400 [Eleusine coracana subsp. coracana]